MNEYLSQLLLALVPAWPPQSPQRRKGVTKDQQRLPRKRISLCKAGFFVCPFCFSRYKVDAEGIPPNSGLQEGAKTDRDGFSSNTGMNNKIDRQMYKLLFPSGRRNGREREKRKEGGRKVKKGNNNKKNKRKSLFEGKGNGLSPCQSATTTLSAFRETVHLDGRVLVGEEKMQEYFFFHGPSSLGMDNAVSKTSTPTSPALPCNIFP